MSQWQTQPGSERPVFPGTEHADPRVLDSPGYTSVPPRNDPTAITAMVLGAAAVIPFVGLGGIVAGHVALHRLRNPYRAGQGLALAGLILSYTLTAFWLLMYLVRRSS